MQINTTITDMIVANDSYIDYITNDYSDYTSCADSAHIYKILEENKDEWNRILKEEDLRKRQKKNDSLRRLIKKVKFNGPCTIVWFNDGDKVVVKCQEEDTFDKEKGLAMACMKKYFNNSSIFNEVLRKWCYE